MQALQMEILNQNSLWQTHGCAKVVHFFFVVTATREEIDIFHLKPPEMKMSSDNK